MEIITQKVFNIRLHRDKERNERASFHNFVIYSSLAPQDLLILLVLTYISYLTWTLHDVESKKKTRSKLFSACQHAWDAAKFQRFHPF